MSIGSLSFRMMYFGFLIMCFTINSYSQLYISSQESDTTSTNNISGLDLIPEQALKEKLVGYWPLDGNLKDVTGNNGEGVYCQNPRFGVEDVPLTFTSDASNGQAIDLRGDGFKKMPHIKTGLYFKNDSIKTFSVFVKTTDFENELAWVGSGAPDEMGEFDNRAYLGTFGNNVFVGAEKYFHDRTVSHSYPVRDNQWHHYSLVVGKGKFKVYQDGELLQLTQSGETEFDYPGSTSSSLDKGAFGTDRGFLIGMGGGQRNHPANAIIDDVAVFSKELSQSEMAEISEMGSVGKWLNYRQPIEK